MKVQVFIPDWPGEKQHAKLIAQKIASLYPYTILSDPNDFFNAQWAKARQQMAPDTDVLFWIMADAILPNSFRNMCFEMERIMGRGDIGWYAPDLAWTSFIYDKADLRSIEPEVYEVPNTDSVCFAVRSDVVRAMPHIDPDLCFMWGMDFTAIVTAHLMGLKTVRDYRFKIEHPNCTGYNIDTASTGMKFLFESDSFSPSFKIELQKWIEKTNQLKRLP